MDMRTVTYQCVGDGEGDAGVVGGDVGVVTEVAG